MATSAGAERKAITHDRGQGGITIHYMSKKELREAIQSSSGRHNDPSSGANLFHGLESIAAERKTPSNPELEHRVEEQTRSISALNRLLEVLQARHDKQEAQSQKDQAEIQSLQQSNNVLTSAMGEMEELRKSSLLDIEMRNNEISALKEERENSECEHQNQLKASKAAYNELEAKHAALQIDVASLTGEAQKSQLRIDALRKAAEESDRAHKARQEASKEAHDELVLKHKTLEDKHRDLETVANLRNDEVCALKEERDNSKREYKIQQEASKAARDELEANYEALQIEVKSLKEEAYDHKALQIEVVSLKEEARKSRETVETLEKALEAYEEAHKIAYTTLRYKCRDLETSAVQKHEKAKSLKEEKRKLEKILSLEFFPTEIQREHFLQRISPKVSIDEDDNETTDSVSSQEESKVNEYQASARIQRKKKENDPKWLVTATTRKRKAPELFQPGAKKLNSDEAKAKKNHGESTGRKIVAQDHHQARQHRVGEADGVPNKKAGGDRADKKLKRGNTKGRPPRRKIEGENIRYDSEKLCWTTDRDGGLFWHGTYSGGWKDYPPRDSGSHWSV